MKKLLLISLVIFGFTSVAFAQKNAKDPLESPQWGVMHKLLLGGEDYLFDDAIKVYAPKMAEDSLNVPVSFEINTLKEVQEIIVFTDLNPIPLVLKFKPKTINPYLAFRIKLQQATPVRVAAKTAKGIWHVNGRWIDAAGGGCTLPSNGTASGDWSSTLGEVSAKLWQNKDKPNRLRVRVMHPMDTGLASGIPKFHIEQLRMHDKAGSLMAELEVFEPISENPMLSFNVKQHRYFKLSGRDNNGNSIDAEVSE